MPEALPSKRLSFGPFELDAVRGELRKRGVRVKLQDQPFQILQILLESPGEIVTRDTLRNRIWPADTFVDFDKGLYNAIKKLREALGDTAMTSSFIETVPKRGYRFIAAVSENGSGEPKLAVLEPPGREAGTPEAVRLWLRLRPRIFSWKIVATTALFILAAATAWFWLRRTVKGPLNEKDTIVVGDFSNTTGESVFDDALKKGLAVDLEQSTFLNILSDDAIAQQLRYMGRSVETRLTPDVAREVCQRENSKAVLDGSISLMGGHYVITLRALDCSDGTSLDVEQLEAESRERVLGKLHEAGRRLRNRLGESLPSIQKNDTPLTQATTSSLEALQLYSRASKIWRSQGESAALPLFKRVLELDPSFAVAYGDLGTLYCNTGEASLCASYVKKAYELRDRATEKEQFFIDSNYYMFVTGELEKAAEVFKQWKQEHSRDLNPYVGLSTIATNLGQMETALNNDLEGAQLKMESLLILKNLSYDYLNLNRLDDAAKILEQARAKKMDVPLLPNSYQLAFLRDDGSHMARCLAAASGDGSIEPGLLANQADTEAFHGHLAKARDYSRKAVDASQVADAKEDAAGWKATAAIREAEFGNAAAAVQDAKEALALSSSRNVQVAAALAFARAGDQRQAERIVADLGAKFPLDSLLTRYWLPTIHAALHLSQKDAALALIDLSVTAPYELGGSVPPFAADGATLYPVYLRGLALVETNQADKAAAEFQKFFDHRGLVWNFPLGVLAHYQLGRAYAASGDAAKAKAAYQDFLSLWHDADPGIPILERATVEYHKLR